jgi:hypothetical protein
MASEYKCKGTCGRDVGRQELVLGSEQCPYCQGPLKPVEKLMERRTPSLGFEREREIIRCFVAEWIKGDMPLPGYLCYQDVIDFLYTYNIEDPGIEKRLEEFSGLLSVFDRETNRG